MLDDLGVDDGEPVPAGEPCVLIGILLSLDAARAPEDVRVRREQRDRLHGDLPLNPDQ